ncbi:MAG: hypothetical protein FWG37_02545, partial [Clostridia bacterium]|nr:hypothetical protein [Clostridia bacterium]
SYDGEKAKEWLKQTIPNLGVRAAVRCLAAVLSAAAVGGIFYMTSRTPVNSSLFTAEAVDFLVPYIEDHKDILFIGDNPHERIKPDTLRAPVRGADENLLAGSYDLYSPRASALMQKFGIENPLLDCSDREDIAYVIMSLSSELIARRYTDVYGKYPDDPVVLQAMPEYGERIIRITTMTGEEAAEKLIQLIEQFTDMLESSEETAEETPAPVGTPAAESPAAEPTAAPTADPAT